MIGGGAMRVAAAAGPRPPLPTEGLVARWSVEEGLDLDAGTWTDTVGGVVMTLYGAHSVGALGLNFDYTNYSQITSGTMPRFKAFATPLYWGTTPTPPLSSGNKNFMALCSSSTYEYAGNDYTQGGSGYCTWSASWAEVRNASVYSLSGYVGTANSTERAPWWGQQDVFILAATGALPTFDRFGRDRNSHEFNGHFPEILFYDVDLTADTALRGNIIAYLRTKWAV